MTSFPITQVCDRFPGRAIEWHSSLDSTMIRAAQLAREGCAPGTVVGADEQTAGIGRLGRTWHSEPGTGLYVSLVLRPNLAPDQLPILMLALALGTREAILSAAAGPAINVDLRWPNDVMLVVDHGTARKCSGILAQLEGTAVVAGIGINVSQQSFPDQLETPATSLKLAGAFATREDLFCALLQSVDRYTTMLAEHGPTAILDRFLLHSSSAKGRRVRVHNAEQELIGVTCGLNPSGFLIIRDDNGKETTVLAGGVRPL